MSPKVSNIFFSYFCFVSILLPIPTADLFAITVRLQKLKRIQELKAKLSPLNLDTLEKIRKQRSMRLVAPIPSKQQLQAQAQIKSSPIPSPEPQLLNVSNGKRDDFTPSPTPEPRVYDTEADPDNVVIRGGSDIEEHEYDEEGRIIIKPDH